MTVVDLCQRLIRAESTPGREGDAIAVAAQAMRDRGFDDVVIDRYGNLIGRIGPEDGPALLIDGHIDTIPLADAHLWTHPPLGAEIADGQIVGLGASDMKGPVAAFIHGGGLLVEHRARLRGPVYFVVSIAEEMTEGATLRRSFDGREIAWCVIAEPTGLELATCQRGRAKVAVEFHGASCHAANAERGENAADHAINTALRVRELPTGSHPLLGRRDINLIDIHSEPYPSISTIPNWCLARWDVRFLPGETKPGLLETFAGCIADGVRADVRYHRAGWTTYTGDVYDVDDYAAAWETPRDHPLVATALAATGAEASTYQFGTNGSYFAGERGIPTVGYGPADPGVPHTVNESIPIDQLERAPVGYRDIALALLGDGR
jgi:putative selenium metabolism hydrolase